MVGGRERITARRGHAGQMAVLAFDGQDGQSRGFHEAIRQRIEQFAELYGGCWVRTRIPYADRIRIQPSEGVLSLGRCR